MDEPPELPLMLFEVEFLNSKCQPTMRKVDATSHDDAICKVCANNDVERLIRAVIRGKTQ